MADNDLRQTKTPSGAKAPAAVSKPAVAKPGANTARTAPSITARHSAQERASMSRTSSLANTVSSTGTINERQTPIVPKSSLSETANIETKQEKIQKKIDQRLKSSNISMDDLEQINEQNLRQYRSRVTRNRVVIITLIALLVATIAAFAIVISVRRMANNCTLIIHGNVDAEFVVNGEKLDKFRTPIGVQGNRVYAINTDIDIHSTGSYNVYFTIEVFQSGNKLNNTFAYEYNHNLFRSADGGKYVSIAPISGGQKIDLFEGVVLDDAYENTLNVDNFTMQVHIYFERA